MIPRLIPAFGLYRFIAILRVFPTASQSLKSSSAAHSELGGKISKGKGGGNFLVRAAKNMYQQRRAGEAKESSTSSNSKEGDFKASISYYLREGWYRHIQEECNVHLARRGNDTYLLFWRAVSKGFEGSIPEALRELEQLRTKREVEYPAMAALLFFHRRVAMVDYDACEALEAAIPMSEDGIPQVATMLAARFYTHIGRFDDASRLLNKLLGEGAAPGTPLEQQAYALRGWAELLSQAPVPPEVEDPLTPQDPPMRPTVGAFPKGAARDLETLMGRARFYECHKQYPKAIDELNTAVAAAPWFWPALVERGKLHLARGDADHCAETCGRALEGDPRNPAALRLRLLAATVSRGVSAEVARGLADLVGAMDEREPRNPRVLAETAKCFARCSGRHREVLEVCLALLDRARALRPQDGRLLCEVAYQQGLSGQYARALATYQEAAATGDDGHGRALAGVVYCQVMEGQLEDAEGQLELLTALHGDEDGGGADAAAGGGAGGGGDDDSPAGQIAFLQALLAWRRSKDARLQVEKLKAALGHHRAAARRAAARGGGAADPFRHLIALNADRLVELAEEFLTHSSTHALSAEAAGDKRRGPVALGLEVLERVTTEVPGFLEAHLLAARAAHQMGEHDRAQRTVAHVLALKPESAEAHLLAAQVAVAQDRPDAADRAAQQAVAYDFAARQSPVYLLVRARVLLARGDPAGALAQLEAALRLPGVRDGGAAAGSSRAASLADRASIFVAAAEALALLHRADDAKHYIAEAQGLFRGTPEEVRILVANSELALQQNDFQGAVRMLDTVPRDSPVYVHTQRVKANIYLQHRRDKPRYIRCFQDMVAASPSFASYVQLGEAYMAIQSPEAAVEAYENALQHNPRDAELTARIARAVVSTHDYKKAMLYFEKALQSDPDNRAIRLDLAKLYLKQKMYDQSARILEAGLDQGGGGGGGGGGEGKDLPALVAEVKLLRTVAEVHAANPAADAERRLHALRRAKDAQRAVLGMVRLESPDVLGAQKREMAALCVEVGRYREGAKDDEGAAESYQEALRALETHAPALLALAALHLRKNDLDRCAQQCERLLRLDQEAEAATMLLADVLFARNEFDAATAKYQELLGRRPNHYQALAKLITLLRRAGRLDEVGRFLEMAEKGDPRSPSHAGLRYCRGLYHRYANDPHAAVTHFNLARRDGEWGGHALANLVEIYLNPDNENLWDAEGGPAAGDNAEAVRVAERLLRELNVVWPGSLKFRVLENYAYLASKQKASIDRALQNFFDLLEQEKEYVPALLGMSVAYMLDNQQNKARNTLKRIAKMPYSQDLADDFERSYLMLGDLYIQRGKFDLAQDLCKRCLSYNKSCGKAWEAMGLMMEKEQSYEDASECYEKAWKLHHEASATVGFKLAFNHLKAKRYVEAITVCNKVLEQFPDYPKIRKEILEKAQGSLRP